MKKLLFTKWAGIVAIVLLVVLLIALIIHWQPARTVARKQIALEEAIDSNKPNSFKKLVSETYKDRWNFSAEDLAITMVDIRSQYILLVLEAKEPKWDIDGSKAKFTVKYRVSGQPKTAAAGFITQKANSLQTPFLFTWEKKNFLPWSWQLTSFDNETIPDKLYGGYKPGDLSRKMKESDF